MTGSEVHLKWKAYAALSRPSFHISNEKVCAIWSIWHKISKYILRTKVTYFKVTVWGVWIEACGLYIWKRVVLVDCQSPLLIFTTHSGKLSINKLLMQSLDRIWQITYYYNEEYLWIRNKETAWALEFSETSPKIYPEHSSCRASHI